MERVYVALSGGVDSATTAALLKEQGYEVLGVFIKIWQPEFLECTWQEDRLDAMRVAAALDIPFDEVDFSEEYRTHVVALMLRDYENGITPNPDVLCNRYIKFDALWEWAKERGAQKIATGHHAHIQHGENTSKLIRGVDPNKDQTYFLWQLTQDDLAHTLMPIGTMTKNAVRREAARFNVPVADKSDSQGLCFVGDVSMHDFLKRMIEVETGSVLNTHGEVIGSHDGAALYTRGQRHNFRLSLHTNSSKPLYVLETDVDANTITVGSREMREETLEHTAMLRDTNWITKKEDGKYHAQVRYQQKPQACTVNFKSHKVVFEEPQLLTSGQSLVVYDEAVCIGGGVIV